LLLKDGEIHRQLNRDYYFSKSFDYPIALTQTGTGRVVIVHCPRSYDELELEDAESGEILNLKKSDKMEFHSRLAASPNGEYLLSAGWFWHPLNGAWLFSIGDVIGVKSERVIDLDFAFGAEIDSAAFLGDDSLVVTSTDEVINPDVPVTGLGPMRLGVWSIADEKWTSVVELPQTCGTMMPWRDWVISFHEYPKAIELATGQVVHRWEEIYSGRQVGAIELGTPTPPPLALDPIGGRFAVGGPDGVTVVTLSTPV
jgi:hypothetical protein